MRFLLPLPLLAAACAEPVESTDVTIDTAEINGATSTPTQSQIDRAVRVTSPRGLCSGTRIAHRWVITAAHCKPRAGDTAVTFYDTASMASGRVSQVVDVILPPGVAGDDEDCVMPGNCDDTAGNHADMALLRISDANDEEMAGPNAVLAWTFPGQVHGWQVGNGEHDGNTNTNSRLLRAYGEIDDDTDSDGSFTTVDDQTDSGDSGGPMYVSSKIVGVLTGSVWVPLDHYNLYTAVPHRLDWILDNIGYRWQGAPARLEHRYGGTTFETFWGSLKECQYACENTGTCEAYNYFAATDQCALVDNVTTTTASTGWRGALKHGGATGVAADAVGYVRADNRNVVVHAVNGHLHELAQISAAPGWEAWELPSGPETPASKLSAYKRSDGVDAIVYRNTNNAIIEVARTSTGWTRSGFSTTGTPTGSPVGFVRADGENAIIYRTTDGHIRQLHLASQGQWRNRDLTVATGAPNTSSDVSAFRRSDGVTSIVYRSGNDIWELYQRPGEAWAVGNLSSLTTNGWAPSATGRPHGYRHADGTNAIAYRAGNGAVVEIRLASSGWLYDQLSSSSTLVDPTGYVRSDGVDSVVTRSTGNRVLEMANGGTYDLSSAGGGTTASAPMPYMRTDGYNSVLFEDSASAVLELFYRKGENWGVGHLTSIAREGY